MNNNAENISVRILYWKEIPLQVEVVFGEDRLSSQLDNRFKKVPMLSLCLKIVMGVMII